MSNIDTHVSVMSSEVLGLFGSDLSGKTIVDATYGRGGYSVLFLRRGAFVFAIDRDPDAVLSADSLRVEYSGLFSICGGCFGDLGSLLPDVRADGVVFDLGLSSPQLGIAERGFSFSLDAPLDMRMSKSGESASDIVNSYSEADLRYIFRAYGEEPHASRIARAIMRVRARGDRIETTFELSDLVCETVPRRANQRLHPATRVFQALRIAVNDELGELERGLRAAVDMLNDGGRLVVVSFHSLEDRIVKNFYRGLSRRSNPSRHLMFRSAVEPLSWREVYNKPLTPDISEIEFNPRSRSAKLRVLEKLTIELKE